MKKKFLISLLILVSFAPNIVFAGYSRDEYKIEYNGKSLTYEELGDMAYGDDVNKVLEVASNELERLINEIENIINNPSSEGIIEKYKLQLRLGPILNILGGNLAYSGGIETLLKFSERLRQINYPINDDEIKAANSDFNRDIEPTDLIELINNNPDTDYEKEGLYLLATEYMGYDFRLKVLDRQLQAANLFLEKYPDDPRTDEVRNILEKNKTFYTESKEDNFNDMEADNYLVFSLENGAKGAKSEWGSEDFALFPAKVKKKPLEDVLNDKLGHVEIINNGLQVKKIVIISLVSILALGGIIYGVARRKKKQK